jgi:hypothetical protein
MLQCILDTLYEQRKTLTAQTFE